MPSKRHTWFKHDRLDDGSHNPDHSNAQNERFLLYQGMWTIRLTPAARLFEFDALRYSSDAKQTRCTKCRSEDPQHHDIKILNDCCYYNSRQSV